jgi:hypothetical protein
VRLRSLNAFRDAEAKQRNLVFCFGVQLPNPWAPAASLRSIGYVSS